MARLDQYLNETAPSASAEGDPTTTGPVGASGYVARQGDCIASIAFQFGLDAAEVWNHADNADLRERRGDPSLLLPGDRVALPEAAARASFDVSPGGTHRFKAKVPKHEIKLQLKRGSEPRSNRACTVVIDGVTTEMTTDDDGALALCVRPSTRFGTVTVHDDDHGVAFDETFRVEFGGLDPATEISGVQSRLRSLGYNVGPVDGDFGARTRRAIEQFQAKSSLTVTGEPDEATRNKLVELFGI